MGHYMLLLRNNHLFVCSVHVSFRAYPPNSDESSTDLMLELQKLFAKIKDDDGTTEGITRSLCITNGELFHLVWLSGKLKVFATGMLSYIWFNACFMFCYVVIFSVYEQQDAVEYYQRTLKAIGPQFSKVGLFFCMFAITSIFILFVILQIYLTKILNSIWQNYMWHHTVVFFPGIWRENELHNQMYK